MYHNRRIPALRAMIKERGHAPFSRSLPTKRSMVELLEALDRIQQAPAPAPVVEEKKLFAQDIREKWILSFNRDAVCHFAALNEKAIVLDKSYAPCHAALGYARRDGATHLLLDIKQHYLASSDKTTYQKWVMWWLNESHMSFVFITKTWDEAFEYGVLVDGQCGINEIVSGCIGLREGSEFGTARLPVFKELIDLPYIDKKIAWLVSCNFRKQKDGTYRFHPWDGGHQVMNAYGFHPDGLFNWMEDGTLLDKGSPFAERVADYKVSYAVSVPVKNGQQDIRSMFVMLFQIKEADGWGGGYENISFAQLLFGIGRLSNQMK